MPVNGISAVLHFFRRTKSLALLSVQRVCVDSREAAEPAGNQLISHLFSVVKNFQSKIIKLVLGLHTDRSKINILNHSGTPYQKGKKSKI
jgi:hypothetical protein